MNISQDLDVNIAWLNEAITDCPDYSINTLKMKDGTRFIVFFVDNLVNKEILSIQLLPWLLQCSGENLDTAKLPIATIGPVKTLDEALTSVATGGVFFLLDGKINGFEARLEEMLSRGPESSDTEKDMRGSRDAFVENVRLNMAIMRTRFANHRLKFKTYNLGAATNQGVAIGYLDGVCNPKLLAELVKRVEKLDYDGFVCSSYVEQMITDKGASPFPRSNCTERVDKAEAALLEGRFLIFVQGAPNALILPVNFWGFFQAMDDFSQTSLVGSIIGTLRVVSLIIAIFLPGLYVAILTYHYYAVPLNILTALTASRSSVIFTPLGEAIMMELLFEIIREAAIRLPTSIGGAIGIVGGIIIGQTAIETGLVSNVMVIVVSITAIASFVLPSHDLAAPLRLSRFVLIFFAGFFGLIGMMVAATMLVVHLGNLTSLGQPYLMPAAPFRFKDWANNIVRLPFSILRRRPSVAQPIDALRGKGGQDDES